MKHLSGAALKGRLLALPQAGKVCQGANTLAYYKNS
jgi:hypothetical protein